MWLIYATKFITGDLSLLFFVQKELAKIITLEQGKTLVDAEGDVHRGLRKLQLTRPFFKN